ncbi:MAG: hypothetical protein NTV86_02135 [Planctomycetota bacterium]|nr:hypothetical protein [Planctomycetota bacterium]
MPMAIGIAAALLWAVGGCSTAGQGTVAGPLDALVFPASELPRDVRLAPWRGSDKIPQMTANPFWSTDRKVLADFEDGKVAKKGSITEILIAIYWSGESAAPVEIALMATRYNNPAVAAAVARALQAELDHRAKTDPRSAGAVMRRGTLVCFLSPTSVADRETWSAMRRLLEERLEKLSRPAQGSPGP